MTLPHAPINRFRMFGGIVGGAPEACRRERAVPLPVQTYLWEPSRSRSGAGWLLTVYRVDPAIDPSGWEFAWVLVVG